MSDIFHIELLRQEFERRSSKNPQYSLRGFARDLAVSVSWLSEVFKHKKGISEQKALHLCVSLKLSRKETQKFILSVRKHHSRKKQERVTAQHEFEAALSDENDLRKFSKEEFNQISHWFFYAILELIGHEDCDHSVAWLARRLNLPHSLVEKSLEKMQELNMITIQEGRIQTVCRESETSVDIPTDSIRTYHRQLLQKADNALSQQPVLQREFLNMTMSFHTEQMDEAKKEIRKFQRIFADRFYPQQGPKNSVYQFSLQFFRLDHPTGGAYE